MSVFTQEPFLVQHGVQWALAPEEAGLPQGGRSDREVSAALWCGLQTRR